MSKYHSLNALIIAFTLLFSLNLAVAKEAELPPPQVAVSPSIIETTLGEKPSNEVIHVYNLGNEPMTVTTSVVHWDTDENNRVRVISPTEQSLDQWIIINPLNFTVPAGESQVVRLSIRSQTLPTAGEHRGMVFFENKKPNNANSKGVSALFRIGIGIYGLAGDIIRQGSLESLRLTKQNNKPELAFTISSTGNANIRLAGQYSVWRKADFPADDLPPIFNLVSKDTPLPTQLLHAADLPSTPVLANTTRTIITPVTLPEQKGIYTVFVNAMLGETPIKQALDIHIP